MSESSYAERKCSRCGKVFIFHPEWVYTVWYWRKKLEGEKDDVVR